MPFSEKLSKMRKQKGFTQGEMAKMAGVGIAQLRRYEGGKSSPTLEVIKNIAKNLRITSDELIFDKNEGVAAGNIFDKELLEQFEEISKMKPQDKNAIKIILESMILKNRLEEIMPSRKDEAWSKEMRQVVSELRKGAEKHSNEEIDIIVDDAVKAVRAERHHGKKNIGA